MDKAKYKIIEKYSSGRNLYFIYRNFFGIWFNIDDYYWDYDDAVFNIKKRTSRIIKEVYFDAQGTEIK